MPAFYRMGDAATEEKVSSQSGMIIAMTFKERDDLPPTNTFPNNLLYHNRQLKPADWLVLVYESARLITLSSCCPRLQFDWRQVQSSEPAIYLPALSCPTGRTLFLSDSCLA